jgi:hypothetical protein
MTDGGRLYLWVTPSGGKLWRWANEHSGKGKLMTFGRYPDVPLALARERHGVAGQLCGGRQSDAKHLSAAARVGKDSGGGGLYSHLAQRSSSSSALTVGAFASRFNSTSTPLANASSRKSATTARTTPNKSCGSIWYCLRPDSMRPKSSRSSTLGQR